MKQLILAALLLIGSLSGHAQTTPEAFRLFDNQGRSVSFQELIATMAQADVAFFGEIHNCPVAHWMELRVLEALNERHPVKRLAVGMEMLEADCQLIIDEYMQGIVSSDRFEAECRLWDNYATDYQPLVYFAKTSGLQLTATNVPRRYAAIVKDRSLAFLDSLSAEAKALLPPLPIAYESNEHANAGFAMMSMLGKGGSADPDRMAQAQALKDATMAWNIARMVNEGRPVIHFNGNIHSDGQSGILTYLRHYAPGARTCTLRSVRQDDIRQLDDAYKGLADFYLVVPEDMTMTY